MSKFSTCISIEAAIANRDRIFVRSVMYVAILSGCKFTVGLMRSL